MKRLAVILALLNTLVASAETRVYFGTGGGSSSRGIYMSGFDPVKGELGEAVLAAEVKNPNFICLHPNGKFLYSVGELQAPAEPGNGSLCSFAIQSDGLLKPMNQRSTGGAGPCYVCLDPSGRVALAANYSGGSISSFPVQEDGSLGARFSLHQHRGSSVNPKRQGEPHAHSILPSPDGRFAFAADLGLDRIFIHQIDATTGGLIPHDPPSVEVAPGSGPRHLCFHPSGKQLYVINEMLCTITTFAYEAKTAALKPMGTVSTLPVGVERTDAFTTSEIVAHPNGKFVFGATRGHDSISVFAVGPDGSLTLLQNVPCGGKIPRHFNLDPTGRWLLVANQGSDNVSVLRVDAESGRLEPGGRGLSLGRPMCIRFLPH